tara:strand:- start:46 stop:279 length:234 start_codon:yes stop_codon:yes gene_type:complete
VLNPNREKLPLQKWRGLFLEKIKTAPGQLARQLGQDLAPRENIRFDILPHHVIIVVTKATPMESPTLSENSSLEHMF